MNKSQAYAAMCQGHKVCNEYYSPEEFAFMNQDGLIEYEDGCVVGDQFSENWVKYQDPENKLEWSICDDRSKKKEETLNERFPAINSPEPYLIRAMPRECYESTKFFVTKPFTPRNHKQTNKRRK